MTRKEALQELLVKVKAGDGCKWDVTILLNDYPVSLMMSAFDGSLDAALSLFEAVLPGWEWWLESGLGASIRLKGDIFWSDHTPFGTIPSRALLIAILEALVGMEDG